MLVVTAVVCGVLLLSTKLDLKALGGVITDANPTLVFAALAANLVSVAAKGLTWKASLDAVEGIPGADQEPGGRLNVHFSEVVPAIFIGFLLNTVLFARLGEVARISVLRRKLSARGVEVPLPTMVGTLVTEQLLSGVTLIAVLLGVTVFVSVPGWAVNLLLVLIGVVLVIAVAACAIEVWARYRRGNVPNDSDIVERWWHLLGISLGALPLALRQGQALFRRPRRSRPTASRRASGRQRWCSWRRTWSACSRSCPATWWCSRAPRTPLCRSTTCPPTSRSPSRSACS